jgi:hypothetical protein
MNSTGKKLTHRRILPALLVVALGLPTMFSVLPGCESTPAEPEYSNPFDPQGPDGGDPLKLTALATNDTTVRLTWNQPQDMGITSYSLSLSAYRDSGYSPLGDKDHTENPTNDFFHQRPDPTTTHWYMIQAFTATDFTITSYATPDSATTGPRVIIGEGKGTSASRFVNLEITVTQGEMLRIALDPDFTENLVETPAGAPDEPVNLTYDLGSAQANNENKTVHVVAIGDGYESLPSIQNVRVEFKPDFKVAGDPRTVATRLVDLSVPAEGVINMRFFAEYADTGATPWVPADTAYYDYELSDSANPQFIRGQFQGDFGFDSLVEIQVTPDLLTDAVFNLVLPDTNVISESVVKGASQAVATEMRFSESADFTGVPWVAYQDTTLIQLSPTPGMKVVHAQYRNDWTMSGVLTDIVYYIAQPAEVAIWTPSAGDPVQGGSVFQVQGTSTVGAGEGSVVLVQFDGGDGEGFRNVDGTDTWSTMWDVPRFTEDTGLTIRAKAWYGANPDSLESVTTAVTVTVTQLAALITSPLDGADLTADKTVTITGTAAQVMGGAAVDSVVIDVGDEHLEASGTTNWTAEWKAPLEDTDQTLTMTATAWAGTDTAQHTISVNVVRDPVVITYPEDGELVDGEVGYDVTGFAWADLFTATVDSVALQVTWDDNAVTLPAALGGESWNVIWNTPVVEANTSARLKATAFAGLTYEDGVPSWAESHADSITVTVKP